MKLRIINSRQTVRHEVSWIDLVTTDGGMIILPEHSPMVATLAINKELSFKTKDGRLLHVKVINGGIIEITRTQVTVLL